MHAQADMEQAPKSKRDHTETMQQFTDPRLMQLEDLELHGYILKKDSPRKKHANVLSHL